MGLNIDPTVVPMLDAILFSFVILERGRREEVGRGSASGGGAYVGSGTPAVLPF